ncbi:hypothetical protein DKX38_008282 [Salix brachista]|uniref:Uncharacterized protein n=1 Tax=Salix brachista TaxID=2182728 RepID=A0A5N5MSB9_9ROSI|nr:hypothetical protein DKX38_008282 [Salix brachista]
MEGASNGKNEETKTVERQEVVEVVDAGNKSVKEVVIDSTAESMKETIDENNSSLRGSNSSKEEAEAKEKTVQVEDSGTLEVVEKEEVDLAVGSTESVEERLTEGTEALVGKSDDSDVAKVEVKETKEKVLVPLNETGVFPSVVTDQNDAEIPEVVLNATDGSSLSVTDGSSLAVTDEVSEGIEEKVLKSFDENNADPPALTDAVSKGIEEKKLTALEESTGESSCNVDKEAVENFQSADVVGSSDAFPESTRDPPVTSLQQRNLCPCWRSCCGLFEALGRSDR